MGYSTSRPWPKPVYSPLYIMVRDLESKCYRPVFSRNPPDEFIAEAAVEKVIRDRANTEMAQLRFREFRHQCLPSDWWTNPDIETAYRGFEKLFLDFWRS